MSTMKQHSNSRSRGALWRLRDWGRHLTAHSLPKQPVNSQAID